MSHDMKLIEATRARFRPERVMTLFVGESAPARGGFFYFGNNATRRMRTGGICCHLKEGAALIMEAKGLGKR